MPSTASALTTLLFGFSRALTLGLCVYLLIIVCVSGLSGREASAQDVARGEQLFRRCGQCHGPNAEGNELVGGPRNGHRYLDDSNLDWSPDATRLKLYMDERGIETIHVRPDAGDNASLRF